MTRLGRALWLSLLLLAPLVAPAQSDPAAGNAVEPLAQGTFKQTVDGVAAAAGADTAPPPAESDTQAAADGGSAGGAESAEEAPLVTVPPPPDPPLVARAKDLTAQLQKLSERIEAQEGSLSEAAGEDRAVLAKQVAQAKLDLLGTIGKLVGNLLDQEDAGLDPGDLRARLEELLQLVGPAIVEHIAIAEDTVTRMRTEREEVEPAALLAFEQQIAKEITWLDRLYAALADQIDRMEALGLDTATERPEMATKLEQRAALLAGRADLAAEQRAELAERAADKPDDPAIKAELAALEVRKQTISQSLSVVIGLMGAFDLDASRYRQLLITSTGEVTADIFRAKVALGLFQQWIEQIRTWMIQSGPAVLVKVLFFLLTLSLFWFLAGLTRRILSRALAGDRPGTSKLLRDMSISLSRNTVMAIGLLVGLSQLGLELGPILAGLGIAGFIVGFALQDSLANFAAGMMILGYRPFDVGDVIEAATVFGKVSHMSLVSTTILTFDNQTLIVPNAKIWGDVIKNVTHQKMRRVDMTFRISYADDIDKAEEVLRAIVADEKRVLEDPEPIIKLHELGENAVEFICRPWTRTEHYWDVYWDVTREVKRRFDAEGISIPVPQRDVVIRGSELLPGERGTG